jgi:anti-sigma factor RsiW
VKRHLEGCVECAGKLKECRATMALLDEWQAPEPSPYFDTRLQARLREEQAHQAAGWWAWLQRAALAGAMAVLLVGGISFWRIQHGVRRGPIAQNIVAIQAEPGTAVGDLQILDKNNDLYANFDELDDLQVQDDVTANP